MHNQNDLFLIAASVPMQGAHAAGNAAAATKMLAAEPQLAKASIYCAAVAGDAEAVKDWLQKDASLATAKGGPYGWDALTYLCFSMLLRESPRDSTGFTDTARILLDAGADPNTGWWEDSHHPHPEWEPVLYGAAGLAHHAPLTKLLIERGADPNDNEVVYHTPEDYDNEAMKVLLDSGLLTPENKSMMLVRKHDWHDVAGVKMLLATGMDVNVNCNPGKLPLLHAVLRDNSEEIIRLLLDHGADPTLAYAGHTPYQLAARRGRGDLLALFEKNGFHFSFNGTDKLVAACAVGDGQLINKIKTDEMHLVSGVVAQGGTLLAEFAGTGNAEGVLHLLDLGIPVTALYMGDAYFGIPPKSMALHVACWRAQHNVVRVLIEREAPLNITDGHGRTPLMLAIRACVDSYWSNRRKLSSIEALLDAGAFAEDIMLPTGYPEADELIMKATSL
jgi:ankyrin repeat protein